MTAAAQTTTSTTARDPFAYPAHYNAVPTPEQIKSAQEQRDKKMRRTPAHMRPGADYQTLDMKKHRSMFAS